MAEYVKKEDVLAKAQWFEMYDGESEDSEFAMKYIDPDDVESIPAADVVEVVHGPMRVEVETFDDHYREHYFCPSCGIEIGHKTWNEKYQFGQGTVLHTNKFPNYCPNCGADMRVGKAEKLESHSKEDGE